MSLIRGEQITGSVASASYALTASYTLNVSATASYALQALSSSFASTASYALNSGTTIDTGSFVTTSSFNNFTASYNTGSFTGSFYGSIIGTASYTTQALSSSYAESSSYALTASYALNVPATSSYALTASFALNAVSSSFTTTASYAVNAVSSSYAISASNYNETDPIFTAVSGTFATTGSNNFKGNQTISGSIYLNSGSVINSTGADIIIKAGVGTNAGVALYNNSFTQYLAVDDTGSYANKLTVADKLTIAGSNGKLIYTGTTPGVGSNPTLAEVHANDDFPWLHRFYNDTFSTSSAVMAYYGWNDGRFVFHNESTQSIGLQVNGFGAENGLLVYSDKVAFVNNVEVTGSLNVVGGITGSLFGTASWAQNAVTASYTPNYLPLAGGTINGNVTINGTASIAFLNVTYESASVIYSSGSNQFGDATNDTQTLIGTVKISGSLQLTGSANIPSITGSLFGTASYATQALTASYASTYAPVFPFTGNAVISGSLTVTGSATFIGRISQTGLGSSIFIGQSAGFTDDLTTNVNLAIGNNALYYNKDGTNNVAIGQSTLFNNTGSNNVALGAYALQLKTTGGENMAIGTYALNQLSTGSGNVAVGVLALFYAQGSYNVGIGGNALYDVTGGSNAGRGNVGIGYNTGRGITTGEYNTIIGASVTGLSSSLSNNIIIADGVGNIAFRVNPTTGLTGLTRIIPRTTTGQTAATEISAFIFDGVTTTWQTGNITTQRSFYLPSQTYAFVGASTITSSYTMFVNAPIAGTNATITNNYAAGFSGSVQILTGGLTVTGSVNASSFTGSLQGTASYALSASFATSASFVTTLRAASSTNDVQYNNSGVLTGSSRFTFNGGTVSIGNGGVLSATGSLLGTSSYADSSSYALTASYALTVVAAGVTNSVQFNNSGVPGGSNRFTFNQTTVSIGNGAVLSATGSLLGTASYADSSSYALTALTASYILKAVTSSYAITASYIESSSYALTASYALNGGGGAAFPYVGGAKISGSLAITGSLSVSEGVDVILDTTAGVLHNPGSGQLSLDWTNAQLYKAGGISIDWSACQLHDVGAAIVSVDYASRYLIDPSSITSVDWGDQRTLFDASTSSSILWGGRQLIKSDGTTVAIDWETGAFTGSLFGTASYAATSSYSTDFTVQNTLTLNGSLTNYATASSTVIGSNNLFTQATGSRTSAFGKYTLYNGANTRAGEFIVAWNGTTAVYTDTSTIDIGNTNDVEFQSSIVGGDVQINAVAASLGWTIKMLTTYI